MGEGIEDPAVRLRRVLLQRLESLHRSGVEQLARRAHEAVGDAVAETVPTAVENQEAAPGMTASGKPRQQLEVLRQEVAACTTCAELARGRTQTVFGVGNPQARLCFFGEAPGADEDRQGEPFVGRAGKLLTDIIQNGMGLKREDVFILNVLKCRPPGNRNPNPVEVDNCRHFFERQLEIIDPEFICCLGLVAAQSLLETKMSVGRLRGHWHEYRGSRVVVTYHPAYLLRSPNAKKETWKDIQMLMGEMGLSLPRRS